MKLFCTNLSKKKFLIIFAELAEEKIKHHLTKFCRFQEILHHFQHSPAIENPNVQAMVLGRFCLAAAHTELLVNVS